MKLVRTTVLADTVLAVVGDILAEHAAATDGELFVEPYQNGREHGWALCSTYNVTRGNKVAFSENRNSDQLVIYCGFDEDFSMQGNVPAQHTWRAATYCDPSDVYNAAWLILKYLVPRIFS